MKQAELIQELKGIESKFFDLDEERCIAHMSLQFESASDMFNANYMARQPVMSDEFLDCIANAFRLVPSSYQIDLQITVNDMEEFSEEELKQIFYENILLEYKKKHIEARERNHLAFGFFCVGVAAFILMMTANAKLPEGGLVRDIFFYICDIAATVTIWEALAILLVEGREGRRYRLSLASRFHNIEFHKADSEER